MIHVTPQMRIVVAIEAVDFRLLQRIDGMAQLCRTVLHDNTVSGSVFVFRNRQRTAIKLLVSRWPGFLEVQDHQSDLAAP